MRRYVLMAVAACCLVCKSLTTCGAATDPAAPPAPTEVNETPLTTADRQHWSFQPLVRPDIPPSNEPSGPRTGQSNGAIDQFIAAKLAPLELTLAPEAPPEILLRRLTFDITGLPPSDATIEQFVLRQHEPDSYLRQVDRLLASPSAGEHWAQHWLDLARYAETDGFEHDKVRPDAWRYRDWVINAINDDMPYAEFMQWQIAGDLMHGPQGAIATMFCLSGPDMPDLNDQTERRHNLLNEMTGAVGAALLGLQLGCAACHDHKYDPISQADFYRLRGILETGVPSLVRDKPWLMFREQETPSPPHFYWRGDHRRAGPVLTRSVPRVAASSDALAEISTAAQPRAALAAWLARHDNPLPARAIANRVWQSHFAVGLAATPSDLGLVGIAPTHPELLDWLASSLKEKDWSLKWLRRQILLSATYRGRSMSSIDEPQDVARHQLSLDRDPDNRLLSRYPRRRLSGESLRDCLLNVANLLNRQAGGPSVMPPLPGELVATLLPGQWKTSEQPSDHYRRSIYVFARRNLRYPIFESFDRPDAGLSCPQRDRSVTATQSLLLMNSELSWQVAQQIAGELELLPDEQMIQPLWQRTLGRKPSPRERQLLIDWLVALRQQQAAQPRSLAVAAAALALMNSNEFITID